MSSHVGEFQELGLKINCQLADGLMDATFDIFIDDFIDQIEKHNLLFGGGGNRTSWGGFITSAKPRGSTTEADQACIKEWLSSRPEVVEVSVGPLVDAWKL